MILQAEDTELGFSEAHALGTYILPLSSLLVERI